ADLGDLRTEFGRVVGGGYRRAEITACDEEERTRLAASRSQGRCRRLRPAGPLRVAFGKASRPGVRGAIALGTRDHLRAGRAPDSDTADDRGPRGASYRGD